MAKTNTIPSTISNARHVAVWHLAVCDANSAAWLVKARKAYNGWTRDAIKDDMLVPYAAGREVTLHYRGESLVWPDDAGDVKKAFNRMLAKIVGDTPKRTSIQIGRAHV